MLKEKGLNSATSESNLLIEMSAEKETQEISSEEVAPVSEVLPVAETSETAETPTIDSRVPDPNIIRITKVDIQIDKVLAYMKKQGRYVTSVEMRDHFDWPLRGTARRLMRVLAEKNQVVIADNPNRKRAYVYGLPGMKKPKATPKPKKTKKTKKATTKTTS